MPVRSTDGNKTPPPLIWTVDSVSDRPLSSLKPYARNNRRHSAMNIARLANSIATFGFVVPIVTDGDGVIICGHGRYRVGSIRPAWARCAKARAIALHAPRPPLPSNSSSLPKSLISL